MAVRVLAGRDLTEAEFQQQVVGTAQFTGWLAYHTHDSRGSQSGFPDLVLVHERQQRVIYAELKSKTGKLSDAQIRWLRSLSAAGCETAVWRPADLPEIRTILQGRRIVPAGKDTL